MLCIPLSIQYFDNWSRSLTRRLRTMFRRVTGAQVGYCKTRAKSKYFEPTLDGRDTVFLTTVLHGLIGSDHIHRGLARSVLRVHVAEGWVRRIKAK